MAQFSRFGLDEFFKQRNNNNNFRYEKGHIEKLFSALFIALDLSLREQEQAFSMLSLAIRTTPNNSFLYPLLLGTLIVLKIKNYTLYRDFVSGKESQDAVFGYIKSSEKGKEFWDTNYGAALEVDLLGCRSRHIDAQQLKLPYKQIVEAASSSENEKKRAAFIIEILNEYRLNDSFGNLNYLVGKIDLVSDFGFM